MSHNLLKFMFNNELWTSKLVSYKYPLKVLKKKKKCCYGIAKILKCSTTVTADLGPHLQAEGW